MRFEKAVHVALAVAIVAGMMVACSDNPTGFGGDYFPPAFQQLTTRKAVLHNIEAAYNTRNILEYGKLLDPDFTFHLSAGDVNNGLPEQWAYQDEALVTSRLFDVNYGGDYLCRKIDLTLTLDTNPEWTPMTPDAYPDQTWYWTDVFYKFQLDVVFPGDADHQLLSPTAAKARFTVRNVGTDEAPQWRLVDMQDLGAGNRLASVATATEQSTWGKVKSLYRD